MYRIYDKPEAIKRVQQYLSLVGNPNIFVAKTGVYDENTRLSVIDFQARNALSQSGLVDKETFDLLYENYFYIEKKKNVNNSVDSFISFPLLPGSRADGMIHINQMIENILNYHAKTHKILPSRFYSSATSEGVRLIKQIFLMDDEDFIDEHLYLRMIEEHNSIGDISNNF